MRSAQDQPAVHAQRLAGKDRGVRGEERHRGGHVARDQGPRQGLARDHVFKQRGRLAASGRRGVGQPGCHAGYLPSAMTPMPSVLSVRRRLMAWYSGDLYHPSAADLVANLSTTVTCPADPSSSSQSRSMTMFSAPWASRVGPTAARYSLYSAWLVILARYRLAMLFARIGVYLRGC